MIESDKNIDATFSLVQLYNFSGKLLLFKLNGNFSNGYVYRDGHIKATMTSTRPNLQSLNTDIMAGNGKISGRKPPTCVTHMVTTGSTTCITVGDYTNCTWQASGYAFYTICDDGTEYGDNTDLNNNNDTAGAHHNMIAQNYITPMSDYLVNMFGISRKDAFSLAWNGVIDSEVFEKANLDRLFSYTYTENGISNTVSISKQEIKNRAGAYNANFNYGDEGKKGTKTCSN